MTLNDLEHPKLKFFFEFFVISGCDTHKTELRRNGYRPTQPAYDIYSIKRRF